MSVKRELNEYLAAEWGDDWERATDDRPFFLTEVGRLDEGTLVFSFEESGDLYYAFGGRHFSFQPADGMGLDDLRLERSGSAWLSARDPVDDATSRPGDERVPSGLDRRAALDRLAEPHGALVTGVFLTAEQRYAALAEPASEEDLLLLGGEPPLPVPRVATRPHRRLAHAVGVMLDLRRAASGGAPEG